MKEERANPPVGQIETWFPLAIYKVELPDAEAHRESMLAAAQELERTAQQRRAPEGSAWTGDIHGVEQIHNDARFAWIVAQVEEQAQIYLNAIGVDLSKIDLYIQRSWPVLSRKNQPVGDHCHHNANLSAVYYIAVPKDDGERGSTVFYNDAKMNEITPGLSTPSTNAYAGRNYYNSDAVNYEPVEGRLLLFPSKHRHSVKAHHSDELRVTLSFDLVITSAENGAPGKYEFLMPPPSQWRKMTKYSD